MNNKAFTLIELLVAVLIIGILAVISVPKYQKARNRAVYSKMMAAIRQLNTAQQRYILENGHGAESLDVLDIDLPGSRQNNFSAMEAGNCKNGSHLWGYSTNNVIDMGKFEVGIASSTWRYPQASLAMLKGEHCRQIFSPIYPMKRDRDGGVIPVETFLCYVGFTDDQWCYTDFGTSRGETNRFVDPIAGVSISGSIQIIRRF